MACRWILHHRMPSNSQQSQSYNRQKLRKSLFQNGFQIYNSEILVFPQMNLIHFVGRPRFRCYKFEIHFGKVVFSTSNGCNFAAIGSQKASDSANSICVSCTVDLSCFQDETNVLDTTNLSGNIFFHFFNIFPMTLDLTTTCTPSDIVKFFIFFWGHTPKDKIWGINPSPKDIP